MKLNRTHLVAIALCGLAATWSILAMAQPQTKTGPAVAHIVVVELKDHSQAARETFVKSCHKYLADHPGTLYFAVGTIADDLVEPVSDREFDVVIHLVFEDKDAELKYLKDPRHVKFVEENLASFAKVRVFDTYISKAGANQ